MKIKFSLDEIRQELEYENGLEDIITLKSDDKFFVGGGCEAPYSDGDDLPNYVKKISEYAMKNVAICTECK